MAEWVRGVGHRLVPGSVRGRLTAAVTLAFAAAVGLSAWGLVSLVERQVTDDQQAATEEAVLDLIAGADLGTFEAVADGDAFFYEDEVPIGPAVAVEGPGAEEVFGGEAVLIDPEGATIEGEEALAALEELLEAEEEAALADDFNVSEFDLDTPSGPATLVAASPVDEIRRSTDALRRQLWLVLPVLIVAVGAGAWILTGRALRPVEGITRRVESITSSTLADRVPDPGTDDEVGHLARTMNVMLERLERSAAIHQRFVTDASHELRSPVAVIRSQVEVALREGDDADWPAVADQVLAEDARLEAIVADLLVLARGDAEPSGERRVDVDLDDLVRVQAARVRSAPVDAASVAAFRLAGDPVALDRLVGHLLDNAARHGDHVTVTLRGGAAGAVLTVDDDGAGVPPADRERIFDRFTRLDESRSRDAGGAGLGLAVVRQVAEAHGGSVVVEDGPAGGARFVVTLPRD